MAQAASSNRKSGRKVIASNRKARHDYSVLDVYEAGVMLTGTEVKSLRAGRASLLDGFATIDDGEVFLHNVHIPSTSRAAGPTTNRAGCASCCCTAPRSAG
jgi:SsrA-binding protein